MRNNKSFILSVIVAVILVLGFSIPVVVAAKSIEYDTIDLGPEIRTWKATTDLIIGDVPGDPTPVTLSSSGVESLTSYSVGDIRTWLRLDAYLGYYYYRNYQLMAIGTYGEIWVSDNLSWLAGDSRDDPTITQGQIDYLLSEFDSNIYPTCSGFFGTPDYHDGSNSLLPFPPGYYDGDKVVILIDNIRDENYYDETYPNYIGGFYSPQYEEFFDRNVITIDSFEWDERVGPDGEKPYLYEGIFAHEFQHLIHDDLDADEETWLNEGCSDFAEFLCGYGHPESHVSSFANYAENSLVVWGDQGDYEILADYGIAYLWTLNLYESYGGSFIQALVTNPDNGIIGVNSTLSAFGYQETFADIFRKWSVSLITDPGAKMGGAHGFEYIDFSVNVDTPEAYDTSGAPPWGTDFIKIEDPTNVASLSFNGIDSGDFTVTLVGKIDKKKGINYRIIPVNLDGFNDGYRQNIANMFSDAEYVVILVTYNAAEGITLYASYDLDVLYD